MLKGDITALLLHVQRKQIPKIAIYGRNYGQKKKEVGEELLMVRIRSEKIYSDQVKPNRSTCKAMESARKKKVIKAKNFDEIRKKAGI